MNRPEDWDIIWKWQWFRRPLWQPYFRDAAHPEGRPARTTPIWTQALRDLGAQRVLDCNCGLGMRAILLREAGFDVAGTDSSAVAVEHARELAASRDLDITFQHAAWPDLGERFPAEFDAIVNDAFAWCPDRAELLAAARGLCSALKPGGALIFTGTDQWTAPADRAALIEHAWQAAPRFQLRNDYERDGTHLTMVVARDKGDTGVVENYLFVVRDQAGARLETAAICNSVEWTWADYESVCREAGFGSVESVKIPLGRREHALNVARK